MKYVAFVTDDELMADPVVEIREYPDDVDVTKLLSTRVKNPPHFVPYFANQKLTELGYRNPLTAWYWVPGSLCCDLAGGGIRATEVVKLPQQRERAC